MLIGHHRQMIDEVPVGTVSASTKLALWFPGSQGYNQQWLCCLAIEAEYIALAATVHEGMCLTQLLSDIDEVKKPVVIFEDNQGAIALYKNPVNRQRLKHIDVRYHFIRTMQNTGKVLIKYCPTTDMVADLMTKAAT